MTLSYEAQADADVAEAYAHYEAQQAGLGERFFAALDEAEAIVCAVLLAQVLYGDIRARGVPRFPYRLFYWVDTVRQHITVLAVVHTARSPRRWPGS